MAGSGNYPDDWPQRREAAMKRDNFRCQMCGVHVSEMPLEVDHIKPIGEGGGHNLDNLQTLCSPCHYGEKHKGTPPKHTVKRRIRRISPEKVSNVSDVYDILSEEFNKSMGKTFVGSELKPYIKYVFGWNESEHNPNGFNFTATHISKEEVQNKYLMRGKSMTAEELAGEFDISVDDAKLAMKNNW